MKFNQALVAFAATAAVAVSTSDAYNFDGEDFDADFDADFDLMLEKADAAVADAQNAEADLAGDDAEDDDAFLAASDDEASDDEV